MRKINFHPEKIDHTHQAIKKSVLFFLSTITGAPATISFGSTTSSDDLGQFLQGYPAKSGNISAGSIGGADDATMQVALIEVPVADNISP